MVHEVDTPGRLLFLMIFLMPCASRSASPSSLSVPWLRSHRVELSVIRLEVSEPFECSLLWIGRTRPLVLSPSLSPRRSL